MMPLTELMSATNQHTLAVDIVPSCKDTTNRLLVEGVTRVGNGVG